MSWGSYMGHSSPQTRHNRTITIDFHNETTYAHLLDDGKAFLECILAFIWLRLSYYCTALAGAELKQVGMGTGPDKPHCFVCDVVDQQPVWLYMTVPIRFPVSCQGMRSVSWFERFPTCNFSTTACNLAMSLPRLTMRRRSRSKRLEGII